MAPPGHLFILKTLALFIYKSLSKHILLELF